MFSTTNLLATALAMTVVVAGIDAATLTRAEVAAEVKKTMEALGSHRGKANKTADGKVALDPADGARFRADFSRAVALYEQQPDDQAALTGLTYAFMFCDQPPRAKDRAPCGKVIPRAQRIVLKHWVQHPEVRSVVFYINDLEFMDALYEKSGPLRVFIAEIAGGKWTAKFHDPKASSAQRKRAYDMALKYGNAMAADDTTITMSGKTITMVRWKGQGLITSVQKMAVGEVMPDFGFTTLDRKPASFAHHRGKVLLVDFWATWCVPCVAGMPAIKQFRAQMHAAGKPFEAISIDAGDSIEKVIDFQKKKVDMPWTQWHQETFTEEYFRIGIHTLPTYLVLDKNGRILARGGHFDEAMKKTIREALAAG
jgi:thiol-disulfide isomerase/thioredoxin